MLCHFQNLQNGGMLTLPQKLLILNFDILKSVEIKNKIRRQFLKIKMQFKKTFLPK